MLRGLSTLHIVDYRFLRKKIAPMHISYLKLIFRNLVRNGSYTLINLTGLTLGISICLMLFLLVRYELNFDRFHVNSENIYQVVIETENSSGWQKGSVTPYPAGAELREAMPELEGVSSVHWQGEAQLKVTDNKEMVEGLMFADSAFLRMFSFKMLIGDGVDALAKPGNILFTKKMAQLWFGDIESAIGETVLVNGELELVVAGILEDPNPSNHLPFNFIASYPSLSQEFVGFPINDWGTTIAGYVYVQLNANQDTDQLDENLGSFMQSKREPEEPGNTRLHLRSLTDIHFDEEYARGNIIPAANIRTLWVMALIGAFILLIAAINFINLMTALSIKRAKEVGVRKVLGASRMQLVMLFLLETTMITGAAMLISLGLVKILLPMGGVFLEKNLIFDLLSQPDIMLFLVALAVLVILLSGFYPSMVMSKFSPAQSLKIKGTKTSKSKFSLRHSLVILQFVISQVLIISMLVVNSQMNYFLNKPLGFASESIITVNLMDQDSLITHRFKNQLLEHPGISNVSLAIGAPTSNNSIGTSFSVPEMGEDNNFSMRLKVADEDYLETFKLRLLAGRNYTNAEVNDPASSDLSHRTDDEESQHTAKVLVNVQFIKKMGLENPSEALGRHVTLGISNIDAEIVGVTADYNTRSLHEAIRPVLMIPFPSLYYEAGIKIATNDMAETLAFVENLWSETFPEFIYEYSFLDDTISRQYEAEQKDLVLFRIAAGVSILIGCVGLFGLMSFMANQRTKEIGVRKVLGASVAQVVGLFSKEFMMLIGIAFVFAGPASYFLMDKWLMDFEYRINPGIAQFLLGLGSSAIIVFTTIGYRAWIAARMNPANSLRDE